jgi:hypothetical protein
MFLRVFPVPVSKPEFPVGQSKTEGELKSRLGINAVADGRQHLDRSISQGKRDHNRFARPRRATDQS